MGWDFTHRHATLNDIKAEMQRSWGDYTVGPPVAKAAGQRLWAVLYESDKPVDVLLWLVKRSKHEWGYKSMTGGMGPYYYDCPLRLIEEVEAATEPTESFTRWADKVREDASRRKEQAAQYAGLRPGMTIELVDSAIPHVTITRKRKRSWCGRYNGREYRIPKRMMGHIISG